MILLKDLFTLLATGEFSNISLRKDASGFLDEAEYEKVLGHINLGLVELYKRFNLMENEIKLHADPSVETYHIQADKVATEDNISTRDYLQRPDSFDGRINIIEITDVFSEDGSRMVLNNRFLSPAIKQTSPISLKIINLDVAEVFDITYRAYPSAIVLDDDFDLNEFALYIPQTIVEALLYYVASRVYKPMGANNSTANASKSESYQQQYELSCQKIEIFGFDLKNEDNDLDEFNRNGWA